MSFGNHKFLLVSCFYLDTCLNEADGSYWDHRLDCWWPLSPGCDRDKGWLTLMLDLKEFLWLHFLCPCTSLWFPISLILIHLSYKFIICGQWQPYLLQTYSVFHECFHNHCLLTLEYNAFYFTWISVTRYLFIQVSLICFSSRNFWSKMSLIDIHCIFPEQ